MFCIQNFVTNKKWKILIILIFNWVVVWGCIYDLIFN